MNKQIIEANLTLNSFASGVYTGSNNVEHHLSRVIFDI